jgi:hypothetical protein
LDILLLWRMRYHCAMPGKECFNTTHTAEASAAKIFRNCSH